MHMPFGDATGTTPDVTGASPSSTNDWISTMGNVLAQGMNLYGQLQLQNTNLKLIQQGKPPLSAAQVASMAPQVNVGLSPDVKSAVFNYSLVIGVVGFGAFLLLSKRRRR